MAGWAWPRMRTSRTFTPISSTASIWNATRKAATPSRRPAPRGPRDHTYLNLGSYYFYGRSVQRLLGADCRWHVGGHHRARAVLSCRRQHDLQLSLLPAVQCPVHVRARLQPVADRCQRRADSLAEFEHRRAGGFHPQHAGQLQRGFRRRRMAGLSVDVCDDPLRRRELHLRLASTGWPPIRRFTGSPFNGASRSTRNRVTPGVQFLIHANIKASFEYQFRPSQSVVIATNPLTGLPVAFNPFHTNTAVAGLEFVY